MPKAISWWKTFIVFSSSSERELFEDAERQTNEALNLKLWVFRYPSIICAFAPCWSFDRSQSLIHWKSRKKQCQFLKGTLITGYWRYRFHNQGDVDDIAFVLWSSEPSFSPTPLCRQLFQPTPPIHPNCVENFNPQKVPLYQIRVLICGTTNKDYMQHLGYICFEKKGMNKRTVKA